MGLDKHLVSTKDKLADIYSAGSITTEIIMILSTHRYSTVESNCANQHCHFP